MLYDDMCRTFHKALHMADTVFDFGEAKKIKFRSTCTTVMVQARKEGLSSVEQMQMVVDSILDLVTSEVGAVHDSWGEHEMNKSFTFNKWVI